MTLLRAQQICANALEFASSFSDCNTTPSLLAHAERIRAFLEESPNEDELRLRALTAAHATSFRWEAGMPECDLITDARAILAFLDGSGSAVAQVFEAMQSGQVYVRTVRAPDGSLVETVPLSPSEAVSRALDGREKLASSKADPQADRTSPARTLAVDASTPTPEIQLEVQPSVPASR